MKRRVVPRAGEEKMGHRCLAAAFIVMAVVALAPVGAGGQTQAGGTGGGAAPRTAWGDPDLQGRWTNTTTTPAATA